MIPANHFFLGGVGCLQKENRIMMLWEREDLNITFRSLIERHKSLNLKYYSHRKWNSWDMEDVTRTPGGN